MCRLLLVVTSIILYFDVTIDKVFSLNLDHLYGPLIAVVEQQTMDSFDIFKKLTVGARFKKPEKIAIKPEVIRGYVCSV